MKTSTKIIIGIALLVVLGISVLIPEVASALFGKDVRAFLPIFFG